MNFYFTDQIQQSFNKIFHQCNKDIAWEGKAELDALVKLDEEGQKIPGIGDVYAILARVYFGPQFTWIEAGFPEDDTKAYSYLHTAIQLFAKAVPSLFYKLCVPLVPLHQRLKKSCL